MEEWEREVCHSIIVAAGRNRNNQDGGSSGRDKKIFSLEKTMKYNSKKSNIKDSTGEE